MCYDLGCFFPQLFDVTNLAQFSKKEKNHSNLHYKIFQKILNFSVVKMTQIVWEKKH
jgi:hypothetical protein